MKIKYDVTYDDVVELILDKKIGAIHQGRSEVGPRALGNRSIIFDPRVPDGKDIVNTVKKRESFRPFAGSVLEEHADKWFDMIGLQRSPHMTFNLRVKDGMSDYIPSITHVDGTCRIQTVSKEENFHYYNLIKTFYMSTQVPILLNTSFNLAGDAIVETVEQAIDSLQKSELNYVYFADVSMLVVK
jgi:carbamoyltransferase